eukprot:GHRR01023244.1.p1 GENE.GHRR01023244.1~~GHRR01023244.1.p1  ORF type:complete len:115 (+),score=16.17 GHRR01023244.1:218-562(+)
MGIGKDGKPKDTYAPGVDLMAKLTLFGEGCRGSLSQVSHILGLSLIAVPMNWVNVWGLCWFHLVKVFITQVLLTSAMARTKRLHCWLQLMVNLCFLMVRMQEPTALMPILQLRM